MSIYQQMEELEKNISNTQEPSLLFAMSQKYRELEEQSKRMIKNIDVNFELIKNQKQWKTSHQTKQLQLQEQ